MANHGIKCPCRSCCNKFESKGMTWNSDKRRYVKPGYQPSEFKSVYKPDAGTTDTYYGGVGRVDGGGHGHIRVDEQGRESIVRESYEKGRPGARKDATLKDTKTPDRRR